jgi:NADH:ubiquinone oxidoreductase subunit F (NADH-binding)
VVTFAARPRLLAGPDLAAGAEPLADHLARLGPLPSPADPAELIATLEASGLLGRGGAGFPVGRKWRSVAERAQGRGAAILVNGAEGEPLSHKDRALMRVRPHLVLDGAELAARTVGADEIVLYVGEGHPAARRALERAVAERAGGEAEGAGRGRGGRHARPARVRIAEAPNRYISGEESAAVHFVNDGDARPVTTPPRPYQRGLGGRPTVVQNVESLAYAALIARFGDAWYREAGRGTTRGTTLVTMGGLGGAARVREVELGMTVGEVAELADPVIRRDEIQAVLLGGYFGGWVEAERAWSLALDPAGLHHRGLALGCGVVAFLDARTCPLATTARIMGYMAGESAAQCGPCVLGLRSIADATERIANLMALRDDLPNIQRWVEQVRNRGGCRHPDGAVGLLSHGLAVFGTEFVLHQSSRRCSHPRRPAASSQVA